MMTEIEVVRSAQIMLETGRATEMSGRSKICLTDPMEKNNPYSNGQECHHLHSFLMPRAYQ